MRRFVLILSSVLLIPLSLRGQGKVNPDVRILFRGMVMDASTLAPIANSQIMVNRSFSALSSKDGSFTFYVDRNDTVMFSSLGYKPAFLFISDTLKGTEFITGVYLNSDTVSIGEVVIIPAYTNLKSEILNSKSQMSAEIENARYNVAISAYQGKASESTLGDPENNYNVINQRQKLSAFEKGGISSEHIAGFNSLIFLPAVYILMRGLPENQPPVRPSLSDAEIEQVHRKYLETVRSK